MAISKFKVEGEVTTEAGVKFGMTGDKLDNTAFFTVTMSAPEAKLTQTDLLQIIRMFSNCAGSRNLAG